MAKQLLYDESASHDEGEGPWAPLDDARFFDCFQLPVRSKDYAPWEPLGEFDLHSGQITVDGQAWFDCGEMPVGYSKREVWMERGLIAGPHIWQSTGARYGELRVNMKRYGQLEVRPKRHGSVRVAPSQ